jgi:glyoxylase-like metal-dependent hydrolase (beta-lactamase superfamily II)
VLLTHWHPDHVGSAAEIGAWPNVKVWAHRVDAPIIRGEAYGSAPHLTHAEEELWSGISGTVPDAPPSQVDRELTDDEVLSELGASVVSTPTGSC